MRQLKDRFHAPRTRSAPLSVVVAAALLLCVAGCGVGSDGGGNPSAEEGLTDAKARQQIYDYLRQTLAELPAGSKWSLTADSARGDTLDPGFTLVCADSDGASPKDSPVSVQVGYWLNGVPPGHEAAYFDQIRRIWERWGWQESPGADGRNAIYKKPRESEGYALVVNNAQNGPGSISVTASSPCFWSKDDATVDPPLRDAQPKVIERPAD